MPCRQPHLFLMTDERMGDALWPALERLPRGAGIIVRHYSLALPERRALFERVRRIARRRSLTLILAGSPRLAAAWKADGAHGRSSCRFSPRPLLRTASAHNRMEWVTAHRLGCDLILVSPIFPTRSHPEAHGLGPIRTGLLIDQKRETVVALGGMTWRSAQRLRPLGITRWAAIDAWL